MNRPSPGARGPSRREEAPCRSRGAGLSSRQGSHLQSLQARVSGGGLAESLRFRPPDLSLIAKRNGGEYPAETVHRIVDGRKPLPGHGGPDMPIWGDAFKNPETGFDDAKVREKIRGVVDHLRTLQAGVKN